MSKEYDDAVLVICESDLDYGSLCKTDAYGVVLANLGLRTSFTSAFAGRTFKIYGDLIEMKRYGKDELSLLVLYRQEGGQKYYARIEVSDDDLKKKLLSEIKPMTGVKLIAKCKLDGVDCFSLVSIESYNLDLFYPQHICKCCGYNYQHEKTKYCCICSGVVEEVKNFYG